MTNASAYIWKTTPSEFGIKAQLACSFNNLTALAKQFPTTRPVDLPFLCLDLTYTYELLVSGFGLQPLQTVTPLSAVDTGDMEYSASSQTENTWTLGLAVDYLWNAVISNSRKM